MIRSFFEWLDMFESSIWLREATYGYPSLLTAHVVTLALFAGLIIMMDLRLLGIGNLRTPISQLQRRLFPWQMLGLAVMVSSGLILLLSEPLRFYGNPFFRIKLVLLALAFVNAMTFHFTVYRRVAEWDSRPVPPLAAQNSPALSAVAPLKAPRTWPNSSLSSSASGSAAQLIATSGAEARSLRRWMIVATRLLPVPVSPVMRIGAVVAATRSITR